MLKLRNPAILFSNQLNNMNTVQNNLLHMIEIHLCQINSLAIDVNVEFSLTMMQDSMLTDGRIRNLRKNPRWSIDK